MSAMATGRRIGRRVPHPRNRKAGLGDLDMGLPIEPVMADGITMSAALRYLPERSFPAYFGHIDCIRCRKDYYQARFITLPFDTLAGIDAFSTDVTTQKLNPGSILYGLSFDPIEGSADDFEIQITDICSGRPFWSGAVAASALRPSNATGLYPVLIEPICLPADKDDPKLKVEITNKADANQKCQLLIIAAEPCGTQLRPEPFQPERPPEYPWNMLQDESMPELY